MNELLRALREGGMHSTAELARRLGLSEGIVAVMAEELARHGYLAALDAGCSGGCKGCIPVSSTSGAHAAGSASACSLPRETVSRPALFTLTEKGRRAAGCGPHPKR